MQYQETHSESIETKTSRMAGGLLEVLWSLPKGKFQPQFETKKLRKPQGFLLITQLPLPKFVVSWASSRPSIHRLKQSECLHNY